MTTNMKAAEWTSTDPFKDGILFLLRMAKLASKAGDRETATQLLVTAELATGAMSA